MATPNYIGGDAISITCNHPTLGTLRFSPKANEANTPDKGGIRNDDDESSVTGGGQAIWKMNLKRWSYEAPIAVDLATGIDEDNVNALAASTQEGIWTFVHISGAITKGSGKPVGDVKADTNTGTLTLKVAGSGKLETIS